MADYYSTLIVDMHATILFIISQVDPFVYNMLHEDPINANYSALRELTEQIREHGESIELPPELNLKVMCVYISIIYCLGLITILQYNIVDMLVLYSSFDRLTIL